MAKDNKTHNDPTSKTPSGTASIHRVDNPSIPDHADDLHVDDPEIDEGLMNDFLSAEEDHFPPILADMETELLTLFKNSSDASSPPESAFVELFEDLYGVLLRKPRYLALLFDERLIATNGKVGEALTQIRDVAENHLEGLIESGKNAGVFANRRPSKSLAKSIMASFKSMMKDEHRINEMLLELKSPEKLTD